MCVRIEEGLFGGVWVGSAAPRLAVPCGTHCWLPPWHLPPACSAAACLPACCSIQLCGHPAPPRSLPSDRRRRTDHRVPRRRCSHLVNARRGRPGSEARGGGRGHFWFSIVYGKRSSKDTERRYRRGRIQSAHTVCSVLFQIRGGVKDFLHFLKRDGALARAKIFFEL